MDLTTGWDRSAEANNDEHHWQGEKHQRVPGLRRITQTWPQGERVVVYGPRSQSLCKLVTL